VMLVCSIGIWMCSRSTQAGLLLYATVLPLAPEVSTVAPGIEPYVLPLRTAGLAQDEMVRKKLNTVEKAANNDIRAYLISRKLRADEGRVGALAQRLSLEAIRREPQLLPSIAANKFLMTCRPTAGGDYADATSAGFTTVWIYDKQKDALARRGFLKPLMKGITGRDLRSDADTEAFLREEYQPLSPDWFTPLQIVWGRFTLGWQWNSHGADKRYVPGWPALWLLAVVGMIGSLIPRDRIWRFHLPWLMAFAGVWLAVMLTGVVNSRYRFVFEPFCIFYAFLLLDFLWSGVAALVNLARPGTSAL